jgi:hypothetical protein
LKGISNLIGGTVDNRKAFMATLITVGNSEGQRSCDAKCYDATGPQCDCVCGGRNHGVGIKKAQENTHELAKEIAEEYNKKHPGAEVIIEPFQIELFGKK